MGTATSTKTVAIPYGTSSLPLHIPAGCRVLSGKAARPTVSTARSVQRALAKPIGCGPLEDIIRRRGARRAVVALSDMTRPVPYPRFLPLLLARIEQAGIARNRITLVIAAGMHRPMTRSEQESCYGRETVRNYRIVNHTAVNPRSVVDTGKKTPSGARLFVNRHFVEADIRIVTGLIEPHFMAGFSGGRKAVVPGLVNLDAIQKFHGYRMLNHARAANGVVEGNPVHREALGGARAVGVDFAVNVTITHDRRLSGVFAGELDASWRAGVEAVRKQVMVSVGRTFDLVVTSGGGAPLDRTFYQTVKGMVAVLPLLHRGSRLLIASGCAAGIGSREYRELLFRYRGDYRSFIRDCKSADRVLRDQWEYQMQCKVLQSVGVEGIRLLTDGIPLAR